MDADDRRACVPSVNMIHVDHFAIRPKLPPSASPDGQTSEKVLQTFRMPRVLVSELKAEAGQLQFDLAGLILRVLTAT